MKRRNIRELIRNKRLAAGCVVLAAALIVGGIAVIQRPAQAPEFPSYTDPVMEADIEEEETPLASKPKVTTKTTKNTKTTKKVVRLKRASTRTYTKKLPATKKTSKKTEKKSTKSIKTETTVVTATTEKYVRKSKNKTVTKKITTTVKTTTTTCAAAQPTKKPSSPIQNTNTSNSENTVKGKYEVSIDKVALKMDSRVRKAFRELGFKVYVDSSVNYSGHFDARSRTIILRAEDDTVYHELGHFLAFIAGNADYSSSFLAIYSQEKNQFSGVNKVYVTQSSAEYFAESVKDYTLSQASLNSARPKTCKAVEEAMDKITDTQIKKILFVYGPFWA